MSLSKQLGLGFFFVLLIVFVGSLWMNTQNTRAFLQQQLSSHAQDTATSLGLSITPYVGNEEDLPVIETMINAIFDRGDYQAITLRDINNQVLIEKKRSTNTKEIPAWFVDLFPINAPSASTELNDGWAMQGSLNVVSNPVPGYQQLWTVAVQSFIVTVSAFIIALIFVWFLVKRVISQPINRVVQQAKAISKKQFEQIDEIPSTTELRTFVQSINTMSEKLFLMFKKLTNQSEEYRRFAYADLVTGVGNRRAFELAINQLLSNRNESTEGYLFLIRAASLKTIHNEHGGQAGDNYLKSVCQAVKDAAAAEYEHFSIFRLNGSDFALIIENIRPAHAKAMGRLLSIYTKRIEKSEHTDGVAFIGASQFNVELNYKELMQRVDSALISAEQSEQRWQLASEGELAHSNEEWRSTLEQVIEVGKADFVSQAIISKTGNTLYSEWFARLTDKKTQESLPMSQIVPASMRLDYAIALDKLIVQNMFVSASQMGQKVGLNLNRISIFDKHFIKWFIDKLDVYRSTCPLIVLEIPERALVHDIDSLAEFAKTVKSYGIDICVEHFGAQLAGITHLRKLMPDYLKIDGRFIRDINAHVDNQLFVKSLINIAHGLDIRVLAEMVENDKELGWLMDAGIDGVQGYLVAQPKEIKVVTTN
uniref:EAL domain-containing protein n=1 Tax=Ningiella ruwaisensis TaxID=2364274 RepID=UPI00109FC5AA|nr:EAL domain-containing protein [Ningiella ruwaisensis]